MPYGNFPTTPTYTTTTITPWGIGGNVVWYPGKSKKRYGTNSKAATQGQHHTYRYVVVSRQVRGPWDGTYYWRAGRRYRNRPIVTVLRLKRKKVKLGMGAAERGSQPNVLSYHECTRSTLPDEITVSGRNRWQQWSFKGSPFAAIAPHGDVIAPDFGQYIGSEATAPRHPAFTQLVAELRENATAKILDKLKSQDFNAAVTLAQYQETSKTLSDIAVGTVKSLIALKKGNVKQLERTLQGLAGNSKAASSSYLQYTYGISPLLGDIDSAMKALVQVPGYSEYFTVRASVNGNLGVHETVLCDTDDCYQAVRTSGKVEVKLTARFGVSDLITRDASLLGISKYSVLEAGWELIPYSFVADWLLPIGDYLSSLSAVAGLETEWVTETVVLKQTTQLYRELKSKEAAVDGKTAIHTGAGSFGASMRYVNVERKFTSIAPPSPPRLKNPLSGQHLLNAAALIRQLL